MNGFFKNGFNAHLSQIVTFNIKNPPIPLVGAVGDGVTDDTKAIQNLFDWVCMNRKKTPLTYTNGLDSLGELVIDFQGYFYKVNTAIKPQSMSHVTIQNGTLIFDKNVASGFTFNMSYGTHDDVTFQHLVFEGNHVGNGIYMDKFIRIRVKDCFFHAYKDCGVEIAAVGNHEAIIHDNLFTEFINSESGWDNRRATAVINWADDSIITNNIMSYNLHGIGNYGSATIMTGNHIYQGGVEPYISAIDNHGIVFGPNSGFNIFNDNYLDNCSIEIRNLNATCGINNNQFLYANTNPNFAFIVLRPQAANTNVHGLSIQGNICRTNAVDVSLLRVDNTDGTIAYCYDSNIKNNQAEKRTFYTTKLIATEAVKSVTATGAGDVVVDFSDVFLFSNIQTYFVTGESTDATFVARSKAKSGKTVTINVTAACKLYVKADINYLS